MTQLATGIRTALRGAGGGGSNAPRTPIEAPDSLRSISYAQILDLIGEGEIYGFADQANPLSCVYLNETPIANADGSLNFKNLSVDSRVGTQTQDFIPGFEGATNETGVGAELKFDTPWTHALTNTNVNAVRVRISTPQLITTNTTNGDRVGGSVRYVIELQVDGGEWQTMLNAGMTGKASSKYERTHKIDLPTAVASWTLRVRRLTPDSTTETVQNKTTIESYAEIVYAKLRMPMSALVALIIDAEQFNNIPTRGYHIKGRIIKVPANYDPDTREYTGLWDGTFQIRYCNNPAWCFYDMALNTRYGLGKLVSPELIDKWTLYRIAQYCDQLVDDGFGGKEPRFTCNLVLQKQNDALRVMQDMATVFRGILFATGNTITTSSDMPDDPVYTYSPANVVGGKFTYSGSSRKVRHTVAYVSWNDPADFYRAKVEYVDDPIGLQRYGHQPVSMVAVGCTSRGQARRWGLYTLVTERYETDACGWDVGLDGTVVAPGKICNVADPLRAGRRISGRIRSATANSVTVDLLPTVTPGDRLIATLPSGVTEKRVVSNISGNKITVTGNFAAIPVPHSIWAVESDELALQTFRVLSVAELNGDKRGYSIAAIQHVPGKFAFIDEGVLIQEPPISQLPPKTVPSPTGLAVESRDVADQNTTTKVVNLSWIPVAVATTYQVQWRQSNGAWVSIDNIGTFNVDIYGIASGGFEVSVVAIDSQGIRSLPTYGGPYDVPPVATPPGFVAVIDNTLEVIQGAMDDLSAQTDEIRDEVDATIAQMQVLQGQVGDILGADEWVTTKTYPIGDLVQYGGKLYRSLQDDNTAHEPAGVTDAWWEYIGNYASLGEAVGAVAANVAVNNNKITQAQSDITAQSESISENAAAIVLKADASALQTTNATVSQIGDTLTATVADITLLGAHNAGKTAFNLNSNTVKIDGGQTLAQTLTGLQVADTNLGARVDSEQSARVEGDAANASAITSVDARVGALGKSSQNILVNPTAGAGQAAWSVNAAGFNPVAYEDGNYWFNTTSIGRQTSDPIPFGAGSVGTISADMTAGGMSAGQLQVALAFYDVTDAYLNVQAFVTAINGTGWTRYAATNTAPSNTHHARVIFALSGGSINTSAGVRSIKVEFGDIATPFTDNATLAQSASVTTSLTANVGPGGAFAQATTMLDVNGRISGVRQTNNGTTSDFIILSEKFGIVSPAGGARTEYSNGNWRVYDAAGVLRVQMGVWQ